MNELQRRTELAEFLRTRRANLSTQQVGLPQTRRRRTPGLRREEVSELAGVSTAWYTYLEQGRPVHISRSVLESIADALKLSRDERHYFSLLADQPLPPEVPPVNETLRPVFQRILANWHDTPAYITGRRTDILAWNRAAGLVFGDFAAIPQRERNLLWLLHTDSDLRQRFVEPDAIAEQTVAGFRATASQYLSEPCIAEFVAQLSDLSPAFRASWQQKGVQRLCPDFREIEHPQAGRLVLEIASLQITGDPDMKCCVYSAVPGSETAEKLSWLLRQ